VQMLTRGTTGVQAHRSPLRDARALAGRSEALRVKRDAALRCAPASRSSTPRSSTSRVCSGSSSVSATAARSHSSNASRWTAGSMPCAVIGQRLRASSPRHSG
jgi:hypothetical protein